MVRTPSTEYWDENVPHEKIKAMAEYLEDVCRRPSSNRNPQAMLIASSS